VADLPRQIRKLPGCLSLFFARRFGATRRGVGLRGLLAALDLLADHTQDQLVVRPGGAWLLGGLHDLRLQEAEGGEPDVISLLASGHEIAVDLIEQWHHRTVTGRRSDSTPNRASPDHAPPPMLAPLSSPSHSDPRT